MKLVFFFFIIATSIAFAQESSVKQFLWLGGTWKQERKDAYEKWQPMNDTMLGAISYHYIQEEHEPDETDIIFDESIRIVLRGDKYFYIPKPRAPNGEKEVEFEITSIGDKSFISENLQHDFPQRIIYRLKKSNQLSAIIEGKAQGRMKRIVFNYHKQ